MTANNLEPVEPAAGEPGEARPDAQDEAVRAKAAALLQEAEAADAEPPRRGRPRGKRDSRPRKRSGAPRVEAAPEPPAPPAEPTEAEIAGLAGMLAMGWRMLGDRLRRRPLTLVESRELATAAHPVLVKYGGGALEQWGAEIMLAITVVGLWEVTALPAAPITTAEGEVFELGGAVAP